MSPSFTENSSAVALACEQMSRIGANKNGKIGLRELVPKGIVITDEQRDIPKIAKDKHFLGKGVVLDILAVLFDLI